MVDRRGGGYDAGSLCYRAQALEVSSAIRWMESFLRGRNDPLPSRRNLPGDLLEGKPHERLSVQRRLACSAGDNPAGAKVRGPIAWIAGRRETEFLKPIDDRLVGRPVNVDVASTRCSGGFFRLIMKENASELMPAVILAGGLAKRLRPLTETVPKALIEINGQPFLQHLLALLKRNGTGCVVMLAWRDDTVRVGVRLSAGH